MTALEWILLGCFGGAIGAWLRCVIRDECVARGIASWKAILAINLIGSAIAGWALTIVDTDWQRALFLAGALGGFTTFSGMCVDVLVQWHARRRSTAAFICIGTIVGGPLAATAAALLTPVTHPSTAALVPLATSLRGRRITHHGGALSLIALGGALGTALRIAADLGARANDLAPWISTASVNVCGAAFAAFVFRWLGAIDSLGRPRHAPVRKLRLERFLLMGCAGGLTTMSALSLEVTVACKTDLGEALLIASTNVVCGLFAATIGWSLAQRFCATDRVVS